jgi:hypothetical protein
MVDWWQALLLVFGGGLAGLPTAYFVHRWATTASRQGEERQAIRQLRRERLQPLLDFLDMAKQYAAREPIETALDKAHETASAEVKLPADDWQRIKREFFEAQPQPAQALIRLGQTAIVACMAATSVPGLADALGKMFAPLLDTSHPDRLNKLRDNLATVEQLIEQYLAGAEPQARGTPGSGG